MTFADSLRQLSTLTGELSADHASGVVSRMVELTRVGGGFPVSKDLQRDVRIALSGSRTRLEDIPVELCHDPIIPIRFLALANSALYARGRAVTDLNVLGSMFGISRMAEKLEELGTMGILRDFYRGRGIALVAYQNALLRAQLAQRLFACMFNHRFPSTHTFIVSSMAELPFMLLAYTKPHLYAACWLDAEMKQSGTLERPFKQIIPGGMVGCFEEIAQEIGLPKVFSDWVSLLDVAPWNRKGWPVTNNEDNRAVAVSSYVSTRLAHGLTSFNDRQDFYTLLRGFENRGGLNRQILDNGITNTSSRFIRTIQKLKLPTLRLPDYLEAYEDRVVDDEGEVKEIDLEWTALSKRLDPFVFELKACLQTEKAEGEFSRVPQALLCTALALLRGLLFDRCIFFSVDQIEGGRKFFPRLILGRKVEYPQALERVVTALNQHAPDKIAFRERKAVFHGDPLIGDNWPFVVFPIVQGIEVVGLVYADKRKDKDAAPLSTEEQVACIALAEVWHNVPASFS